MRMPTCTHTHCMLSIHTQLKKTSVRLIRNSRLYKGGFTAYKARALRIASYQRHTLSKTRHATDRQDTPCTTNIIGISLKNIMFNYRKKNKHVFGTFDSLSSVESHRFLARVHSGEQCEHLTRATLAPGIKASPG